MSRCPYLPLPSDFAIESQNISAWPQNYPKENTAAASRYSSTPACPRITFTLREPPRPGPAQQRGNSEATQTGDRGAVRLQGFEKFHAIVPLWTSCCDMLAHVSTRHQMWDGKPAGSGEGRVQRGKGRSGATEGRADEGDATGRGSDGSGRRRWCRETLVCAHYGWPQMLPGPDAPSAGGAASKGAIRERN